MGLLFSGRKKAVQFCTQEQFYGLEVAFFEAFRRPHQKGLRVPFPRRGGHSSGASVVEVSLSKLLEESVDIAWVYLQQTSELGDGNIAARFLTDRIDAMIRSGQRNRMFLANMAIIKYRQSKDSVVPIKEDA
jgi:hypothetical protein